MSLEQASLRSRLSAVLCVFLMILPHVACTATRAPAVPTAAEAIAAPAASVAPAPAAAPAADAAMSHVTGGLLPSVAGAPILAGVDLGLYQRNGLDGGLETFTATPQLM